MPVQAIMLGAGNRGFDVYGRWALEHPDQLEFIAVADRNEDKLERFGAAHGIPAERRFTDWRAALDGVRPVSPSSHLATFVCLPDTLHEEAAIACFDADLHLMLEKPVAATLSGTQRVARAARTSSRVLMLGYVLRHTAFFQTLREVVRSGALGEVVTVDWRENVSSIHYAHSYVRGNWRRADASSPMILAKCSHDLDLLGWITGLRVKNVSSFGNLKHFRTEHAPEGAPERCLEGCPIEVTCAFHAAKIYLTENTGWPASVISPDPSLEARRHALKTTNYGRCVYRCDNDVVDHQVAALSFENGSSATFTMHGHSGEEGRSLRIDGTKATLRGVFSATRQELRLEPHDLQTAFSGGGEVIPIRAPAGMAGGGHGGGDDGLTHAFVDAVKSDARDDPASYFESHWLAFAMETARLEGRIVAMASFRGD
jgi:predicted dehydrogenase